MLKVKYNHKGSDIWKIQGPEREKSIKAAKKIIGIIVQVFLIILKTTFKMSFEENHVHSLVMTKGRWYSMNLQGFKEKQKSFGHLEQKSKWHITEQKIRI